MSEEVTKINPYIKKGFIDYSVNVITDRAVPDLRDGLKPVQRRILYAMSQLPASNKTIKSAKVTGLTLGSYHPHGNASIYDALVRLTQDFSINIPLLDKQGNMGSIHGFPAAAERYTECKLSNFSRKYILTEDLNKDAVDWKDNYDNTCKEPEYLPVKVLNYLVNGTTGIAVAVRVNVPLFNLEEVCNLVIRYIDNGKDLNIDEMLEIMPGPDFPTGGIVSGKEEIKKLYETGISNLIIKARLEIDEEKNSVYIMEIPYGTTVNNIIDKIKNYIIDESKEKDKSNNILIADVFDESDSKNPVKVRIKAKKGADLNILKSQLYKNFELETSFYCNFYSIIGNKLVLFNLKEIIEYFVQYRIDTIKRITNYEIAELELKKETIEGYIKAKKNIDEVVKIIKNADDTESAKKSLIKKFDFTEWQASRILDMKLGSLTKLEETRLKEQLASINDSLNEKNKLISKEKYILNYIKKEQEEAKKLSNKRKTVIKKESGRSTVDEDLIDNDDYLIQISEQCFIRKTKVKGNLKTQNKGGKGRKNKTEKDALVGSIHQVKNKDLIYCFTKKGKMFIRKVYQIPEIDGKGKHFSNYVPLQEGDSVSTILVITEKNKNDTIMFVSKKGIAKRLKVADINNYNNLIIMKIKPDDELLLAKLVSKETSKIMLVSNNGRFALIKKKLIPVLNRVTMGVKTLKLNDSEQIISLHTLNKNDEEKMIVSITKKGIGKCSPINSFEEKESRRIKGNLLMKIRKDDSLATSQILSSDEQLLIFSKNKQILVKAVDLPTRLKRLTVGAKIMQVDGDDEVIGSSIINLNEVE